MLNGMCSTSLCLLFSLETAIATSGTLFALYLIEMSTAVEFVLFNGAAGIRHGTGLARGKLQGSSSFRHGYAAINMNEQATDNHSGTGKPKATLILVLMLLLLAGMAAWVFFPVDSWLYTAYGWFAAKGVEGAAVFLLVYIVAVVLLIPGTVLALSAAWIYGFWALPLVLAGATIGASLAFLIARYLARCRVASLVDRHRGLRAIMGAVNEEGWKIVGLARLSPLIPFNLQNYFFGLTSIPFWHYTAATLVGLIPSAAVNVYLGTLGGIALSDSEEVTMRGSVFAIGLVATIAVTWLIARKAREKLAEAGVTTSHGKASGKPPP